MSPNDSSILSDSLAYPSASVFTRCGITAALGSSKTVCLFQSFSVLPVTLTSKRQWDTFTLLEMI